MKKDFIDIYTSLFTMSHQFTTDLLMSHRSIHKLHFIDKLY